MALCYLWREPEGDATEGIFRHKGIVGKGARQQKDPGRQSPGQIPLAPSFSEVLPAFLSCVPSP